MHRVPESKFDRKKMIANLNILQFAIANYYDGDSWFEALPDFSLYLQAYA